MYTSNQVVIYDSANYQGNNKELGEGEYNIYELGIGNNKLNSLTVPAGIKVIIYEYEDFRGRSKTFTSNVPDLNVIQIEGKSFGSEASSIKVEKIANTPGQIIITKPEPLELNAGREITKIKVSNQGDRPIQVGSHFHFFEVNNGYEEKKGLTFDREQAYGKRLNIPAGTAIRFEPGDTKEVELIPFVGKREIYGFNGLVNKPLGN
ncbi:urease subunit beta [Nostoc ellipsosporum NOK]|nr:urease subunit beta [Nostoc ellipsosporum NOK]